MALTEKRTEAKQLYISQSMSISQIAELLKIDAGTIYRWKAEAAEKSEVQDWDFQRQIAALSFYELETTFKEIRKNFLTPSLPMHCPK
jgi:transposase